MKIREFFFILLTYVLTIITPIVKLMLAVGFLVLSDFITGMLAARKRGEELTSKKMRPTVTKGASYMIAIVAAYTIEKLGIGFEAAKVVTGLIALMELKSLDENIEVLTGKSLFKKFLK